MSHELEVCYGWTPVESAHVTKSSSVYYFSTRKFSIDNNNEIIYQFWFKIQEEEKTHVVGGCAISKQNILPKLKKSSWQTSQKNLIEMQNVFLV